MEDIILLQRWTRQRDPIAFNELVQRYAGMVYATSRRILGDAVEAEDVSQECFLCLANDTPRIRRSLAGWLHAAATSRSINRLRSSRRRLEREQRYAEVQSPQPIPDDHLQSQIDEALAELSERLREPIVRHFLLGETQDAIARDLGLSRSAVTRRIERGVEKVRKSLRQRGYTSAPALFAERLSSLRSEGAPPSLQAALGRIALNGPSAAASAPCAASVLTAYASWKLASVLALLFLAAVASWSMWSNDPPAERIAPATLRTPPGAANVARAAIPPGPSSGTKTTQDEGAALSPASGETKSVPEPLQGVVLTSDGQPIANAAIFLTTTMPPANAEFPMVRFGDRVVAHTDAVGRFTVAQYAPDDVYLYARHPDYVQDGSRIDPKTPIRLLLKSGVIVEGRVSEAGEIPKAIEVAANLAPSTEGSRFLAHVEPDGTYRIEGVPPGWMMIDATLPRSTDLEPPRVMSRQVSATEGERITVDFDFGLENASISGVVALNGVPAAGRMRIEVGEENDPQNRYSCTTDESGEYAFPALPSGPARIILREVYCGQTILTLRKNIEIVPGDNRVNLVFKGTATLRAHVKAPDDYICNVLVLNDGVSLQEFTVPAAQEMAEHEVAWLTLQGSGTVVLEGLPSGPHTAAVFAMQTPSDGDFYKSFQASLYDAVPVLLEDGKQVEVSFTPR
ncbi:MAG: sigma-70 family RNA polymerase sigma factor [FCB group bacterium]|jgi:RNA polymerase sigma-70 factor (ECF subfamily)|nr:sigma-70 family RNA polymerase sigma factor [FCB group bacterium]